MNKHNDIQNLRDLSRKDLLELMVQQSQKIDQLQARLDLANRKLEERVLIMMESGSIAEASMRINEVFESAQRACDQYTASVMRRNDQLEAETRKKCEQMLEEARQQAEQIRHPKGG